jgi:hypothetical protein
MIAVALEANQLYVEYLDELKDRDPAFETSITVKVDNQNIRFNDDDGFAKWLAENMQ